MPKTTKYPRKRPFRHSEILRGRVPLCRKPQHILENDLFDIPSFSRECSVMPKSVTKVLETALFDFDSFDEVEFFWVRFTAKEALF